MADSAKFKGIIFFISPDQLDLSQHVFYGITKIFTKIIDFQLWIIYRIKIKKYSFVS